jgi:hypothetical protein
VLIAAAAAYVAICGYTAWTLTKPERQPFTIPASHGRRIAAAYGPSARTLFVPSAEHVRSYESAPATYLATLEAFFDHSE